MKNVTSPDISVIDFFVLMDISTNTPSITLQNNSTQINAANLQWVFNIYSPSGVAIHESDFTSPDRVNWSTPFVQNNGFPKPFNTIEWGTYKIIVKVKDSNGTIFETDPIFIPLCRPNGNDKKSKNTYGTAKVFITTKCRDAKVFIEDRTNYTYFNSSSAGTAISKNLRIIYPSDENGSAPQTYDISQFSTAIIPITQSGDNYQYFVASIIDYDLGNNVSARIKYIANDRFAIYCNLDLSPILCELQKLHEDIENGTCKDAAKAKEISTLVHGKLLMASISMMYPQSIEIDPFKLIDEINKLAGWNCNCCTSGVNPLSSATISNDIIYDFQSDGGDITGSIEEIAGGIRIHVKDYSYNFQMCSGNSTTAFSVIPTTSGNTKNFCLAVNTNQFATEILNVIKNDVTLLNLFTSLVTVNSGSYNVSVDGKCVIPNQLLCNYTFTTTVIDAGQKAFVKNIVFSNGTKVAFNFYFDGSNSTQLIASLNALNLGTFNALFASNRLTISTDDNSNAFDTIIYDHVDAGGTVLSSNLTTIVSKNCGLGAATNLNLILQRLIDYVCDLFLNKIKTGKTYSIKFLQAINGGVDTVDVTSDKDASFLLDKIVSSFNSLVDIVKNVKEATCTNIKGLFTVASTLSDTAIFYGSNNSQCQSYTQKQVALQIMKLAQTDSAVQSEICKAVQGCSTPVCDPVTSATVTYNVGTGALDLSFVNTTAPKYSIFYYRVDALNQAPALLEEIVADVSGTTTKQWTGLPAGQYAVVINALCVNGKVSADKVVTSAACTPPASLNVIDNGTSFGITWGTVPGGAAKVRIEVALPNGGNDVIDYNPSPNTVSYNKPTGVYGQFIFVARTVCNVAANFVSAETNSVIVSVQAPASCPAPTGLEITSLSATLGSFKIVKPVGGTTPQAYTLTLIPQNGGSPINYTTNAGGSIVTWTGLALTANTIYSWEVKSQCSGGSGDPVNGGSFTTPPATSNNSSLTNNAPSNASTATLLVNGSVVFVASPLNTGSVANFTSPNYTTVEVRLKACDAGATVANLTSNAVTYPGVQDGTDPELFIFGNVNIIGGYQVEFH